MSQKLTIKLSEPVEHNGMTYSELSFRKAKTGDLVAADAVKGEVAKSLAILACMADVSLPVMKELGLADFANISEQVAPLMGEFPKATAGQTS